MKYALEIRFQIIEQISGYIYSKIIYERFIK